MPEETSARKILVGDTDPITRQVLSEWLGNWGLTVEACSEAKLFLARLQAWQPTICIMDLNFTGPTMGMAITQAVRKILGPQLPIYLMVNAKLAPAILAPAQKAGANGVLSRPLTEEAIANCLAAHIPMEALKAFADTQRLATAKIPEFDAFKVPALIEKFLNDLVPTYAELIPCLESIENPDQRVEFYKSRLRPYQDPFTEMVNKMRKKPDKIDFEQCIRLFGLDNCRNFLASVKLNEAFGPSNAQWGMGKPAPEAKKIVPFAISTVQIAGEDGRYRHAAFSMGLAFDTLNMYCVKNSPAKAQALKTLNDLNGTACRQLEQGLKVAKARKGGTGLETQLVTATMGPELGKAVLAALDPEYMKILEAYLKREVPRRFYTVYEDTRFNTNHMILGALVCQLFPELRPGFRAALFSGMPALLEGDRPELHALATVASLAAAEVHGKLA